MIKTKAQIHEVQRAGLISLIATAGSKAHLAKMLGVHSMVIHGWFSRNRVSKKGVLKIESHPELSLHFSRENLRPDM